MVPNLAVLFTYAIACIAIISVPGPSVTVVIANSMRGGVRAGFASVAGTQAGLSIFMVILAAGLETIVANLAHIFFYIKLVGAFYLIWLGCKMWMADGAIGKADKEGPDRSFGGYFWQGFLVILSNPKVLLFFGAFIPQFVDPDHNTVFQTILFGVIFMVLALLIDGAYALAAGRAGGLLTRKNVRIVERISGSCLIGGGLWLAFTRRA